MKIKKIAWNARKQHEKQRNVIKKPGNNIKKQGNFFQAILAPLNNLFGIKVEAEDKKKKYKVEVEAEDKKKKSKVDKLITIANKTIKKTKVLTEDKILTEDQIKILNNLKKAKIATESKKYKVEAESKKKKVQTLGNFFNNLFGIKVQKKIKAEKY